MARRDWRILQVRQEDLSLLILEPMADDCTMSKPNLKNPYDTLVPYRALVGLANATVLGTWGCYALEGARDERQADAENRIRRACEAMGGSQFETEAAVYTYRDLQS